jgi:hypothetical protein
MPPGSRAVIDARRSVNPDFDIGITFRVVARDRSGIDRDGV